MATNILFVDIEIKDSNELNFLKNLKKKQSNNATFAQNLLFYEIENQEKEAKDIKLNITFKIDESNFYMYSFKGGNEEYFRKLIEIFRKKFRPDKNISYNRIIVDIPKFISETIILKPSGLEEIINMEKTTAKRLAILESIS
mgnify:CR=1 FL=1